MKNVTCKTILFCLSFSIILIINTSSLLAASLCDNSDQNCNPEHYILCLNGKIDKPQRLKCAAVELVFKDGRWRYPDKSHKVYAEACQGAFNDSTATNATAGSFATNPWFTSSKTETHLGSDPGSLCVKHCIMLDNRNGLQTCESKD